jgi:lipopolysaccharide heptosyltransferase II
MLWLGSCDGTIATGGPLFALLGRRRSCRGIDLSSLHRILVVRLDDIGDLVLSTPFLRNLRNVVPRAFITLVVKPSVYDLVEHCPYVNEVLTYDPGPLQEITSPDRQWRTLRFAARYLWRRRFDVAIVPRWDADLYHASFVAYWSGAIRRFGYSEQVIEHKRAMNRGYDRLYSHVLFDNALKHEVERGLDLIRFMGGCAQSSSLELWSTILDEERIRHMLQTHGVGQQDVLIALGIGAASQTRRWPLTNFIQLGKWLQQQCGARMVIVGGPEEVSMGRTLQQSLNGGVINAVGTTSLRELGVLLKACALFIGNDSGPMHVAAAAGVPVVEISCHPADGNPHLSNAPRRFGPWGVASAIVQPATGVGECRESCTANEAHCIRNVDMRAVQKAVATCLLKQPSPAMQV